MRRTQIFIFALAALGATFWGCSEKDVTFTTDADQIKLLIANSEAGSDLFRWTSLIVPTDYTVPYDPTGVYRDSVLSHRRTIDVNISPTRINYWYPRGLQSEAVARVIDEFTVRTTRTYADTTIVDTTDRDLTRYGCLLQLGGASDSYKGWYLWGFNGGGSLSIDVQVFPPTGTSFPGDADIYATVPAANSDFSGNSGNTFGGLPYIRLEDIRTVNDGARIAIASHDITSGGTKRPMPRLSAADTSGFFTRTMIMVDRQNYVDTIQTPVNNSRIWNIVYIETRHDTELFFTGAYVFAYRVPVQ